MAIKKPEEFVGVKEIADRIGMSVGFVYKQLRLGRITHLKYGRGRRSESVRIRRSDAEKYIQSLLVEAVA